VCYDIWRRFTRIHGSQEAKSLPAECLRHLHGRAFSVFIYTCSMLNVDWDGAPNAYGVNRPGFPDQTGLDPWESPAHAGRLKWGRQNGSMSEKWIGLLTVDRNRAIEIPRLSGLISAVPVNGPDVLSQASTDILAKFWDNRGDPNNKNEAVPTEGSLENLPARTNGIQNAIWTPAPFLSWWCPRWTM